MKIRCRWCVKELEESEAIIKDGNEFCPFCEKDEEPVESDILAIVTGEKIILKDLPFKKRYEIGRQTYRQLMEILKLDKDVIEFKLKDAEDVFAEEDETLSNEEFVKQVLDDILNEIKKDVFSEIGIDY